MDKAKVAIYCGSFPFAGEFTSTHLCGIQKAALMKKAAASNFEVTAFYEDIGYTGDDTRCSALQCLLRDFASGKFSMMLVVSRYRLFHGGFQQLDNLPFPILSTRIRSSNEYET